MKTSAIDDIIIFQNDRVAFTRKIIYYSMVRSDVAKGTSKIIDVTDYLNQ